MNSTKIHCKIFTGHKSVRNVWQATNRTNAAGAVGGSPKMQC